MDQQRPILASYMDENPKAFYLATAILCALLGALISYLGPIQFGGHDGSVMTNHAWQLYLGYKPYQDLVTYLPPFFALGAKWAFVILGPKWTSFVYLAACYSIVTFSLQALVLRRLGFSSAAALLLSFAVQATTMVSISWWWYNHTTSVLACLFLSTGYLAYKQPGSRFAQVLLAATTALMALAKPNLAGLLLPPVWALLFVTLADKKRLATLLGASVAAALAILLVNGVNPLDVLGAYTLVAGRAADASNFVNFFFKIDKWEAVQTLPMLLIVTLSLAVSLYCLAINKTLKSQAWVAAAFGCLGLLGSVAGMGTNGDHNIVDSPLALIGAGILLFEIVERNGRNTLTRVSGVLLLAGLVLLSANGIRIGAERLRVKSVGPGMFYQDAQLTKISIPGFFYGVSVGPTLYDTVKQLYEVANRFGLHNPDSSVFFGPRIVFSYPLFAIKPPKGIPFDMWDRYNLVEVNGKNPYIEDFKAANFEYCVFFRQDYVYFSKELVDYLYRDFDVANYGNLTIHMRKKGIR